MFRVIVPALKSAYLPWRTGTFVWLALCAGGGCSSQNFFPVSGKVLHKDGKPVTAGLVIFEPVGPGSSSRGEIQSDGSFQLGTNTNTDGALPGEYKVLIAPPPLPEEGKRLRSSIAAKYQSLDSTPLKFTVSRERSKNKFNIDVE